MPCESNFFVSKDIMLHFLEISLKFKVDIIIIMIKRQLRLDLP